MPKLLSLVIGKRLKQVRLDKGLTLEEAGKIQDCSYQYIQQVEAGKINMGMETLSLICKKYKVKLKVVIE